MNLITYTKASGIVKWGAQHFHDKKQKEEEEKGEFILLVGVKVMFRLDSWSREIRKEKKFRLKVLREVAIKSIFMFQDDSRNSPLNKIRHRARN